MGRGHIWGALREGWLWDIYGQGDERDMRGGRLFIDLCKCTVHRIEQIVYTKNIQTSVGPLV